MPDPANSDITRRSFTQQAPSFEDPRFNSVLTTESDWLFDALPRGRGDLLLDVAAGTGIAARSLAREVRSAVALDATPAMLELGRQRAAEEGLTNIVFMVGDAAALPFLDASFDVTVCRYALHHFPAPDAQLAEMARVLRPGGHLALADLIADPNPTAANVQNHLERLRDPSHAHALAETALQALLARHGFRVVSHQTRVVRRPVGPWVQQTQTPAEDIAKIEMALVGEIERRGPATGLQPGRDQDGQLTIAQTLSSIVATKPA
ncbi:MAG TPA: methyltransferase domain-containing protein [Solirubrobacteraceae bacterium]|nr:methyltransferase domain-containing protein [Solirubrobacteraceae bacterium]